MNTAHPSIEVLHPEAEDLVDRTIDDMLLGIPLDVSRFVDDFIANEPEYSGAMGEAERLRIEVCEPLIGPAREVLGDAIDGRAYLSLMFLTTEQLPTIENGADAYQAFRQVVTHIDGVSKRQGKLVDSMERLVQHTQGNARLFGSFLRTNPKLNDLWDHLTTSEGGSYSGTDAYQAIRDYVTVARFVIGHIQPILPEAEPYEVAAAATKLISAYWSIDEQNLIEQFYLKPEHALRDVHPLGDRYNMESYNAGDCRNRAQLLLALNTHVQDGRLDPGLELMLRQLQDRKLDAWTIGEDMIDSGDVQARFGRIYTHGKSAGGLVHTSSNVVQLLDTYRSTPRVFFDPEPDEAVAPVGSPGMLQTMLGYVRMAVEKLAPVARNT